MKKTLLGALAFVLVIATMLAGTVLAADDTTASDTLNVATVKMVDANHPIKVDGQMDEAYTTATPLLIAARANSVDGLYTHGYARFVWSKAENALYCHVIMNDAEVNPPFGYAWNGDSVELYVDYTNTGTQEWGLSDKEIKGGGALARGLQYRIDGFKGTPTCYLLEELGENGGTNNPGNKSGEKGNMYWLDEEAGRLSNWGSNVLINENRNLFGWEYANDDPYKRGWGQVTTPYGYMVEFRVNGDGTGAVLKDGMVVRIDLQVNDAYGNDGRGNATQLNVYYSSTYRTKTGDVNAGSVIGFYDTITLSEETVDNTYEAVAEAKLGEYGLADATLEFTMPTKPTERTYTSKVTIDRIYTTRKDSTTKATQGGNDTPGGNEGGNTPGGNEGGNTPGGNETPGGDTEPAKGGCGGSVAIGTSVAMLALVGATGFFAFRKKDEE